MNHPRPEEWVAYVYGEAPSNARRELAAHLQNCEQCREEIETWKRSLNRLDSWKLPRAQPRQQQRLMPVLRWAAAAVVLLMGGIWIGRASAARPDLEKLRAAIAPQIHQDIERQMSQLVRQEVARAASVTLASSQQYSEQVGQQVYVFLKKDLDTVALNAAAGLRSTERQLVQLADYKEPQNGGAPIP